MTQNVSSTTKGPKKQKTSNILNTLKSHVSHKSKLELFQNINKNMAPDEVLISDFSCALLKDIYVHGRLYISRCWLSFYANTLGWETLVTIKWGEVMEIKREKTAKLIPNAIHIVTGSERYFFSGFIGREDAYISLVRVWQNASMGFPMTASDLKTICEKKIPLIGSEIPVIGTTEVPLIGTEVPVVCTEVPLICSETENEVSIREYNFDEQSYDNIQRNEDRKPVIRTTSSIRHHIVDSGNNFGNAIVDRISQVRNHKISSTPNAITTNDNQFNTRVTKSVDSIIEGVKNAVASLNAVPESSSDSAKDNKHKQDMDESSDSVKDNKQDMDNAPLHDIKPAYSVPVNTRNTIPLPSTTLETDYIHLMEEANENSDSNDQRTNYTFYNREILEKNEETASDKSELENLKNEDDVEIQCPCHDIHKGREYVNEDLNFEVDELCERLFSQDSDMMKSVFSRQKFKNIKYTPYQQEEDGGSHSQILSYTIPLNLKLCNTVTKHTMLRQNTPGSFYVIEAKSKSEGVPYGDAFDVRTRYCITRTVGNRSRLRVTSHIVFTKSVFGFVKNLITTTTHKGVSDYMAVLVNILRAESDLLLYDDVVPPTTLIPERNDSTRSNFRDISGILKRIKDYKSKMVVEEKEVLESENKGKNERVKQKVTRTPAYRFAFMSILFTSLVLFFMNAYLLN